MKKVLALFLLLTLSSALSLAGTTYINAGEYESDIQLWNTDKLIVNGGGSDQVIAWNSSSVEIYSTTLPLSLEGKRGVYDIFLNDSSTLLFSGGATQSLKLYKNSTALLKGGTINYITIYHRPQDSCFVTIDCQDGWEWLYTGSKITGIRGLWHNGSPFQINLSNVGAPWPDTAQYVHVFPEPATMILFGVGGICLLRKRCTRNVKREEGPAAITAGPLLFYTLFTCQRNRLYCSLSS